MIGTQKKRWVAGWIPARCTFFNPFAVHTFTETRIGMHPWY